MSSPQNIVWAADSSGAYFSVEENFAANGYAVLYTNPRGSTGYGQDFVNGIQYSYPGKDYDDLMAGVDAALAKGFVDDKNLFVCGGSGGGVRTAWIVGHTDRFAAAVSMRPVINWHSFVGTTDGASWYYQFQKRPWEDPMEFAVRSPLNYVANVKTPTMVMTGEADLRTPMGPQRRVLPRAEDAEERDAAGADAGRVPRLAQAFASTRAAALPDGLVREAHAKGHGGE
jgi:dipeptidyl aminopeptidase/acylaminoacyl peptidase